MIKVFEGSRKTMNELARKEKGKILEQYYNGELSPKEFLVKLGELRKITYKFNLEGLFVGGR